MSVKSSNQRTSQKKLTRERILAAAIEVFEREGILAATSLEIARAAGVSHGSVFVHFGTKEGLLVAAIRSFGETLSLRLHELCDAGALLRAALAAHLDAIREREAFYTRLVVEAPLLPPDVRECLVLIQSTIAFHVAPAVQAAKDRGEIRELSLPLLFNTWLGLVHHYLANRELFAPGTSLVEARGRELLDHFMSMIETGGSR